ncbi:MAG: hypothetical protein ACJAZW_002510 [Maritalea sp.]|jgi:hypothetical protein
MVAVCHNMECRYSRAVDLDSVISRVGQLHRILPVLSVKHFSERLVCPNCSHRGMFVWTAVNDDVDPQIVDPLFSIMEWDERGHCQPICQTKSFKIAVAAYDVAMLEDPRKHITLQERARLLKDSRAKCVG